MLSIKDLQVSVEEKEILRGLNFDVKPGEVHAIMGPNGSGKVRFPRRWQDAKITKSPTAPSNLTAKICWRCRRRSGLGRASLWPSSTR